MLCIVLQIIYLSLHANQIAPGLKTFLPAVQRSWNGSVNKTPPLHRLTTHLTELTS